MQIHPLTREPCFTTVRLPTLSHSFQTYIAWPQIISYTQNRLLTFAVAKHVHVTCCLSFVSMKTQIAVFNPPEVMDASAQYIKLCL